MSKASNTLTTATAVSTPGLPSTSRRRLLAGSGLATIAAVFALPVAVPPVCAAPFAPAMSPDRRDAALIAACATFFEAEKAMYALPDKSPDEEHTAALDRYHEAYGAVEDIRPSSLVGLKAKTRVMMSGFEMMTASGIGSTVEDSAEWQELGVWKLMHDVLAMGSTAA
jgi:hypothetical protein